MADESAYCNIREKIKLNLEDLVKYLEVEPMLPYLYQEDIITEDENERIGAEVTRRDKAKRLLRILLALRAEEDHRPIKFVKKLQTPEFQPYLALKILDTEINESPSLDQESIDNIRRKPMVEWSVDDVFIWLKSIQVEDTIAKEFREEKISGDTLSSITKADIGSISSSSKFGDRDQIIKKRDAEQLSEKERLSESREDGSDGPESKCTSGKTFVSENFRNFDCLPNNACPYSLHSVFPPASTVLDNFIEPVHSYVKLTESSTTWQMLLSFSVEIVPFICACLNDRTNGTCHFGVTNDGKIVGVRLKDGGEVFQRRLNSLLESCFSPEQLDIVKNCVRPVRLVEVKSNGIKQSDTDLYVMEVDVVPAHSLCTDEAFFAKTIRGESSSSSSSTTTTASKDELQFERGKVFRFENGKPVPFSDQKLIKFMETKATLAKLRREREQSTIGPMHGFDSSDQRKKLKNLLCQGGDTLDDSIFPIFVLGPTETNDEMREVNAEFLNHVKKKAVFDFCDATSKTSIFCKHEESSEVPVDVLPVEHFDSEKSEGRACSSAMSENRSANAHSWIFCNGCDRTQEPPMEVFEWKRNRRKSFVKAVEYFDENIPREHAVVVFLVFSKRFDVMLSALEEFCLKFGDNWLVICEDVAVASVLKQQMKDQLKIIQSEKEFHERSIVGMSWDDVSATILQTFQRIPVGEMELAMSSSGTAVIDKKFLLDLEDLEVLSSNHYSKSSILDNEENLEALKAEKERRFYEGEEVEWWNFFFENQVIKRDILDEIVSCVEELLFCDPEDSAEYLSIVSIYHLPGSGATTLAKHVLWKLKSTFRCAVVKRITSETSGQLSRLLAYKEPFSPKPVLVLLDNFDEMQVQTLKNSLEREIENLRKDIEDLPIRPFVLLECTRVSTEDTGDAENYDPRKFEIGHCLSSNELEQFQRKYDELEKSWREKSKNLDPKMLISFNILRENFSVDYIQRTVQRLVRLVTDYTERQLLKYIAFIGAYDPDFHSVPTSCFDELMRREQNSKNSTWLKSISRSLKALINYDSKDHGMQLTKIRIIHPLLSREIYKEIVSDGDMTPADVMTEFLFRMFPHRRDAATKELLSIAYSLAIKRVRGADGRYKSDFSPVIQSVIDDSQQDNACAIEILKKTHELTGHVVVAQHLARLYNYLRDWVSAIDWIETAIAANPNQEVFYNTYGNIFKAQLDQLFEDEVTDEKLEASIPLVKRAMEIFRKEQTVANAENNNPSGLLCEGNTILNFVQPLKRALYAKGLQIRDLLNNPGVCRFWDMETIDFVTSLSIRAEEIATELEMNHLCSNFDGRVNGYEGEIKRVTELLRNFLGLDRKEVVTSNHASMQCLQHHRSQLFVLGGNSFAKMLQLYRAGDQSSLQFIFSLATENNKSPQKNMRDMQALIGATLLLNLPKDQLDISRRLPSELKRLTADLLFMSETLEPIRTQTETYLFYAMLHWPPGDLDWNANASDAIRLRETVEKWQRIASDTSAQYLKRHYILFFLARGDGIQRIVPYGNQNKFNLEWFKGTVVKEGQFVQYNNKGQRFEIPFLKRQCKNRWMKEIYFALAFSWLGPVVCETRVDDPGTRHHGMLHPPVRHAIGYNRSNNRPALTQPSMVSMPRPFRPYQDSRCQTRQRYPSTRWRHHDPRFANMGNQLNHPRNYAVPVTHPSQFLVYRNNPEEIFSDMPGQMAQLSYQRQQSYPPNSAGRSLFNNNN